MIAVELFINENKLTQKAAADLLGTTQPKISNIVNGNIDNITIDLLVNMLAKAEIDVHVSVGSQRSRIEKTAQSFTQSYSVGEFYFSDDYHEQEVPYTLSETDWDGAYASIGGYDEITTTG